VDSGRSALDHDQLQVSYRSNGQWNMTTAADLPGEPGGLVIFLNGTSSSGKSSIAQELLPLLDDVYYRMAVDSFHAIRGGRQITPDELPTVLRKTWMGFHRAVAGMAAAGNNIVVDHILSEEWRLLDCLELLDPQRVVLVGIRCALPELERRELVRGDRPPGLAARQIEQVHAHGAYDVEVDSGTTGPLDCARQIREFLRHRPTPTAFERLRALRPTTGAPVSLDAETAQRR